MWKEIVSKMSVLILTYSKTRTYGFRGNRGEVLQGWSEPCGFHSMI